MKEFGTKDGCGDTIVMGNLYGYSTDSNGVTSSIIAKAMKFTPSGRITLTPVQELCAYSMYKPEIKTLSKTVSVKPMKLFPVHSFNGS